jgi:hypothetical protein
MRTIHLDFNTFLNLTAIDLAIRRVLFKEKPDQDRLKQKTIKFKKDAGSSLFVGKREKFYILKRVT